MRILGWIWIGSAAGHDRCLGPWPGSMILPKPPVHREGQLGSGLDGRDVIALNLGILEVTPGDTYINEDLWKLVDESGHDLERKAVLRKMPCGRVRWGGRSPRNCKSSSRIPKAVFTTG